MQAPRRTGGSLLVAATLLAVSACTGDSDEPADPFEPLPKVEYATGSVPQDRDADAVTAALARIDPCALLDPAAADLKGYPKSLPAEADGPHVCEIENAGYDEVRVALGVELPATGGPLSGNDRFTRDLVTLGGAKAYVNAVDSTYCRVALPVSFTHAIEFTGSAGGIGGDSCHGPKGFAAAAARTLERQGPALSQRGPGRWPACTLLREAVGELPQRKELRMGADFLYGMDECGVWQTSGSSKLGVTGAELQPVAADVSLQLEYTSPEPEYGRDFGTVNGRVLDGYRGPGCNLAWNEWAAPPSVDGDRQVARLKLSAPGCARARELAGRVTKVLDHDRPRLEQPQRPVLYAPDEADIAAPRGCENIPDFAAVDCAAYTSPDVPEGGIEVIRAAEADPNVNCAFALDAVRRYLGEQMRPVTAVHGVDDAGAPAYACGFAEPDHRRQLWIRASSQPMGQEPGSEVAGRPARDLATRSEGMRQLWVALDGATDRGHVYAEMLVTPDRSTGMFSDSPVDRKPLGALDEVLADIMTEHF